MTEVNVENKKSSYRDHLMIEFTLRKARNKSYSLRAFARDLGLNASHLSRIFKFKSNLSIEMAKRIAEKIGLQDQAAQEFLSMVRLELANQSVVTAVTATHDHESLAMWVIYYLVILNSGVIDEKKFMQALDFNEVKLRATIDKLLQRGILRRNGDRVVPAK